MCNHVVFGRENVEVFDEHFVAGPKVVQLHGNLERDATPEEVPHNLRYTGRVRPQAARHHCPTPMPTSLQHFW